MFPSHSGGGQEIISLRLQATEHPLLSLVERIRNQESEKNTVCSRLSTSGLETLGK